ncbi:KEU [Symbiodinium necroappetens]|uniref:KEU protein n=1 Tax=Symbiodinium necroappetens TaxID=1628268 RepID=A0A812VET3_9DINO|nr:KEU [Symbiodinium necroappetens]
MSLRRTCRELVLEVVLRRALKAGGDGLDRLQMVVDAASLRVLNSFLRMGDLHSEGVTSVELLEESREPLPGLDALYFLRPQGTSIERVLADFKTAPQHRQVHLCFSQPLESTLLSKLVEAPVLAPRVKSFVEVPLSFVVVQDRGFHFDSPEAIMGLFPEPDVQLLSDTVQKLVDVCRCLQATSPVIRFQSELCQDVAERVQRELSMHKSLTTQSHSKPCQLLILDRSIDMAAALVHEYSYEACVFDLLDGNMLDADRNIVTLNSGGHSKEVLLADPLWEELKYMHLEAARELVEVKVDEVKRQNVQQDATAISTRAMLDQLRAAPEMRDAVDRMALHLAMITQIHSRLNSEQILEPLLLGLLEQDCTPKQNAPLLTSLIVSGLDTGGTGHERRKARRQILTKTTAHAPFLATHRTPEPDRLQPGPVFFFSTVQDIACGIDRSGKDVKITNLQTTLQRSCK